jgi:pimeloyl-ACP methyl ester carboxylesterase
MTGGGMTVSPEDGETDVAVDGVRSVVTVAGRTGSDSAVVFVHGALGSRRDWATLVEEVAAFGRAVAPDMPGYGDADKPESFEYTTQGYARYLGGLIEELGIRRVHLVLHDLGGPWGLAWAAEHPDALASLSLINIGALPGFRWHRYGQMYRRRGLGELVLASATASGVAVLLRWGNPRHLPREYTDGIARQCRVAGTRRAILRYYRATPDLGYMTERASLVLRAANPPTMVIWGAQDPYVPVRFADIQRRYFTSAQVVILPESGHWPFIDDREGVTAQLIPFLRAQTR